MKVEIREEYLTKEDAQEALTQALKDEEKESVKLYSNDWPYVLTYFEEL